MLVARAVCLSIRLFSGEVSHVKVSGRVARIVFAYVQPCGLERLPVVGFTLLGALPADLASWVCVRMFVARNRGAVARYVRSARRTANDSLCRVA